MKYLIAILFVLVGVTAKAQLPSSTFPSRIFNGNTKAQWVLLDSPVVNPILDTFYARYAGTQIVRIQDGDTAFWFYGGARRWFRSLLDRDTVSLSDRITLKLNISDTTNKWWGIGKRWVDTVYRVNDSTVGFTVNGGAQQTFEIKGGASGAGGSGTVTSVGLSLPSAFSVTPSTITTSGIFNVSGAGTTAQYIRGNGTLATTDTGMIPNFYLKVRGLVTGTSPITFSQTTGAIGINNANVSGTKGAASFTGAFSDNGNGLIDLADLVSAGSCTGCNLNIDSKGRVTGYSDGAGGATNNVNIGVGYRPVNAITQEMRTYFAGFGNRLDTVSNASGITWSADTTRGSGVPTYFYVDSMHRVIYANNGLYKDVDTVKWGQPISAVGNPAALAHNTEIPLNGFNAVFTGTGGLGIGTSTVGSRKLNISATSTTEGINITTVDGSGINVVSSGTANALVAQSAGTGSAVNGNSTGSSGYGVLATSSNNNAIPFKANNFNTLTGSATPVVAEFVRNVFGVPANGVGLTVMFRGQTTTTTDVETGQIRNYLSTALHSSRSSAFEFHLVNNAVSARKILLASTGQWTWDGYPGLTAQTDTTTYKPVAIDGSGNVVKMAGWAGSGGGGGGVTSLSPIGSTPNINGATITGDILNLQPATRNIGGVLTKDTQSIGGDKYFFSKRTTFYGPGGKAPIVNAMYAPSAVPSDSLYVASKYLGYGFIDRFASGTVVQAFLQADDHVQNNSHVKLRRSYDEGRSWVTTTIDSGSTGYFVTGLSGGVTQTNRVVVFLQRISSVDLSFIDQRIMYSDDEGATWSAQQVVTHNSLPVFQPYGPLVKIGADSIALSWYGSGSGTYSSYIIKSGDDGITWTAPIAIVSNTTQQSTETSVMYLGGSTLMAHVRREQVDSAYGQYISRDNGNTWSYQGKTPFGQHGTPAWTKTFRSSNGKLIAVIYYKFGAYQSPVFATYGFADSVAIGPQYWNTVQTKIAVPSLNGNGYYQAAHANNDMYSIATYYDETVFIEDATIKYSNIPLGGDDPLDQWETTIDGIYTRRGPVGINNSAAEGMLHVNGAAAKTGTVETVQILSSNDLVNPLVMDFNIGNNATAGNRYGAIQAVERGVSMRPLLLNSSGGNVGVGTGISTMPASPLHVNGTTAGASGYTMRVTDNSSGNGASLLFDYTAAASDFRKKAIYVDANGLNFGSNIPANESTPPIPVITIDNSTIGRAGVDVVAPSARLHIEGGSSFGGTAPLKINSGTLMTTPENGAFENDGSTIYATVGGVRYPITGGTWTVVTGGINYSSGNVGIKNATPSVSLDVKGANAKTGASETVASFSSSDATQALSLFVDAGNNATAGSRYLSLQGVESGISFRPISLQPSGSGVLIGTTTNTGEKLKVVGTVAFDLGSDATGDVYYRNAGGAFTRLPIGSSGDVLTVASGIPSWATPSASATTIYNGDGSISSNRTVTLGTNNLTFNASSTGDIAFTLGSDAAGDTYYRSAGGVFTRLAAGADGDVLTVSSGLPSWQASSLTTLYNGDGTLSGNRNLSGDSKQLNLGIPASKLSGFAITTSGQIFLQGQVQFSSAIAADANYSINLENTWIVLPEITANRTVSLTGPSTGSGKMLIIWNKNSSGNSWSFTGGSVIDATGAAITNLTNDTVYYLMNDGTDWVKIN